MNVRAPPSHTDPVLTGAGNIARGQTVRARTTEHDCNRADASSKLVHEPASGSLRSRAIVGSLVSAVP
jgi:hypothetical protein